MSGGISQLVAIGAQDAHLVGDPQVSFFRSSFKRYTNFSQVRHRQVIQGNPSPGGTSSVRFERKGDLLSYTYLVKKDAGVIQGDIADNISKVELYIGGQLIDTQTKDFSTQIWNNFETANSQKATVPTDFYPLHFFFCDNFVQSLPLVALQYHDVEVRIYWSSDAMAATDSFECWTNFIYLDDSERKFFAENSHSMLIKQVQEVQPSNGSVQDLTFNHPVAYMAGVAENPTDGGNVNSMGIQFKINGTDVGENMEITPHFSKTPLYYTAASGNYSTVPRFGLVFALDLAKNQPSGTLNFSRLDSARLIVDDSSRSFDKSIYAVNYNVLKIENGLGGLMFSN